MLTNRKLGFVFLVFAALAAVAACDPGFDSPGHLAGVAVKDDHVVAVLSACLPDQLEVTYAPKRAERDLEKYLVVDSDDIAFGVPVILLPVSQIRAHGLTVYVSASTADSNFGMTEWVDADEKLPIWPAVLNLDSVLVDSSSFPEGCEGITPTPTPTPVAASDAAARNVNGVKP